jgi:alpha-1,2-mannosyltransferase
MMMLDASRRRVEVAMTVTDPDGRWKVVQARRLWVIAAVAALLVVVAWLLPVAHAEQMADDLRIYRGAIDSMLQGHGLYDYTMPVATGPSPFLYPPFAALIMLPTQALPLGSVETGWILIQMAMTVALVLLMVRGVGWTGKRTVPALAWALFLLSAPVMYNINLGQISLPIVLLALADVVLLPKRWRGTLIGIAGAIKLTPMFFVPYFLITRQWRAAINTSAAFGASTLLGFVTLPHESFRYWTSVVFNSSRIPNLGSPRNLTILGDLKMWLLPDSMQGPLWACLALSVAVLALWAGWRHYRAGEPVAAAIVIGTATTAIGPIAWNHHLVWLVAAGVYMVLAGTKRGSVAGWLLLAMCSLPSPIWPHEEDPVMWRQLVGMIPLILTVWFSVAGLPQSARGGELLRPADQPHTDDSARVGLQR